MGREYRIAAKTVLDASRPHFTMYLPKEAFDRIAELARSTGEGLTVTASKIVCHELAVPWEPAVRRLTVEELRERNAAANRRHYWNNVDRMREKARERAREHYEEREARRREKRAAERARAGGRLKGDPKFCFPSEWNLLSRPECEKRKLSVRQAAYHARKCVQEYEEMLRREASKVVMGSGGVFRTSLSRNTGRLLRSTEAVRERAKYQERLRALEETMHLVVSSPKTRIQVSMIPGMGVRKDLEHCSSCRYFHKASGICLNHGFGTEPENWCETFVDRGLINAERKKCRKEPVQRNKF